MQNQFNYASYLPRTQLETLRGRLVTSPAVVVNGQPPLRPNTSPACGGADSRVLHVPGAQAAPKNGVQLFPTKHAGCPVGMNNASFHIFQPWTQVFFLGGSSSKTAFEAEECGHPLQVLVLLSAWGSKAK